jgi:hypothetical protein
MAEEQQPPAGFVSIAPYAWATVAIVTVGIFAGVLLMQPKKKKK